MQSVFKKIIEKLDKERSIFKTVEWNVAMNKAIETVKQAEAEHKGGWIPCSEGLPEEYGEITDTGEGYRFTMPDGNGIEIYKSLIEEIKVGNETEEIPVLGEVPRWYAYGDIPRYNEYERDKIEKMR